MPWGRLLGGTAARRWVRGSLLGLAATVAGSGCYAPKVDLERTYNVSDADFSLTRLVHGSVVLDFRETRILVDPWYSPTPPIGQRAAIGLGLERIAPLRGLLLTDARRTHFDRDTLTALADREIRVVVPKGLGRRVRDVGFTAVHEVVPWEETQIGSVFVTAVPSTQSGAASGYVLQANEVTVYLAGDVRFDAVLLSEIAQAFPMLDVALLPIGGVRVFGRKVEMSPGDAVEAYEILRPKRFVPYHYELLGPFPWVLTRSYPLRELRAAMTESDLDGSKSLVVLEPGESWHYWSDSERRSR